RTGQDLNLRGLPAIDVRPRQHGCADEECDVCEKAGAARWILIAGLIASISMASYPTWSAWL
ncbi:MAG: hypothetical protein ACLFWG_09910, partial [Longimicrobiales bacterium]